MDYERAQRFAEEWDAAWIEHDLDAILDHYADDVEMVFAARLHAGWPRRRPTRGKDALRAYFAAGLESHPALHFEPIELCVGVDRLVLHYRGARGDLAAEVVFLDAEGKVTRYGLSFAMSM
jgi:ketosteroid isomerase-like protein